MSPKEFCNKIEEGDWTNNYMNSGHGACTSVVSNELWIEVDRVLETKIAAVKLCKTGTFDDLSSVIEKGETTVRWSCDSSDTGDDLSGEYKIVVG